MTRASRRRRLLDEGAHRSVAETRNSADVVLISPLPAAPGIRNFIRGRAARELCNVSSFPLSNVSGPFRIAMAISNCTRPAVPQAIENIRIASWVLNKLGTKLA